MSIAAQRGLDAGRRDGKTRRLGIRAYLILLVSLAIVVPLSTYAILGGLFINSFFEREFTARGETVVRGVAESSLAFIRSAVTVVEGIAEDEAFFGNGDRERLSEHLGAMLALNPEFESFACIDARGIQIASSPPDPNDDGLDLSDRDYARPSAGVPKVSESYISASSGRPVVSISVRLAGKGLVIVGSLDLSQLSDFVAQAVGPDWTLAIVDGTGTIIADRDKRRVQERINLGNVLRGAAGSGTIASRSGKAVPSAPSRAAWANTAGASSLRTTPRRSSSRSIGSEARPSPSRSSPSRSWAQSPSSWRGGSSATWTCCAPGCGRSEIGATANSASSRHSASSGSSSAT